MKKIWYKEYGDVLANDNAHPNVVLMPADCQISRIPEIMGPRQFVVRQLVTKDWYDVWVRDTADDAAVKAALAHINGVTPDEIERV